MFEPRAAADASGGARVPGASADASESVLAELHQVQTLLAALVSRVDSASRWSGVERARVLGAVDRVPGLLASVRAPVLAAHAAAATSVGAQRELAEVRAQSTGSTRWQAATQARSATTLTELPEVRRALGEGVVREGHVDVLARTLGDAPARAVQAIRSAEGQAAVVELARGLDAREFGRRLGAWVAAQDDEHVTDSHEARRRARFLTLTHGADGTMLRGRLDPVSGRLLQRALDATGHRADEDRTHEQARADALSALAASGGRGAAGADRDERDGRCGRDGSDAAGTTVTGGVVDATGISGPDGVARADSNLLPDGQGGGSVAGSMGGNGSRPLVSLLVPAETWVEVRRRQAERRRKRGRGRAGRPGDEAGAASESVVPVEEERRAGRPLAPAMTDDGVVLSADELAVALCDCAMSRVVMDAAGLPLDVGRTRRTFTSAQRMAVVARDRGCAWNGCSVPPAYGEVHHVRWWHRDGGLSDLENAVLLCSFHHHEVHRLDLDVERHVQVAAGLADGAGSGRAELPHGGGVGRSREGGRPAGGSDGAAVAGLVRPGRAQYSFRDRRGRPYNVPKLGTRPPGGG